MFRINKNYTCFNDSSMTRIQSEKPAPVIIAISHDPVSHLSDWQEFLKPRKRGVFGRDKHLWPIIRDMVLLTDKLSVVRGFFPREFIDYNRSFNDIIEPATTDNHELQQHYSNYHNAITSFIERFLKVKINEIDDCLLLDIHGFERQPFTDKYYDIILGTNHQKTIRIGSDIVNRLASFLRRHDYNVYVPTENEVINEKYCGGFTICYHNVKLGINTIQMEIAKTFRTKRGRETGIKLSNVLADFVNNNFY